MSERDRGDIDVSPLQELFEPAAFFILAFTRPHDHRTGTVHEQRSQVTVTALTDPEQGRLTAAGVLPRHKTEPGGQLSAVLEAPHVGDGSHQGTGRDRTDAGDLGEPAARFAALVPVDDLRLQLSSLTVELLEVRQQPLDQRQNSAGSSLPATCSSFGTCLIFAIPRGASPSQTLLTSRETDRPAQCAPAQNPAAPGEMTMPTVARCS